VDVDLLNRVPNAVAPVDCVQQKKKKVALCKLDRVVLGKFNRVSNPALWLPLAASS
jgi:hypothetical protein